MNRLYEIVDQKFKILSTLICCFVRTCFF